MALLVQYPVPTEADQMHVGSLHTGDEQKSTLPPCECELLVSRGMVVGVEHSHCGDIAKPFVSCWVSGDCHAHASFP